MSASAFTPTLAPIPGMWTFLKHELRPKGPLLTTFNVASATLMLAAAVILAVRFATGLSSVSNLDQEFPWGLWKGFNVITGVAFAGGAYVLTFLVYVLGLRQYHSIVRATVLNGLLAYAFYAGALLLDLGRPWNVMNPIIGNSFGLSSVLFLVAWHFLLYMTAEAVEFSPAVAQWLGLHRVRSILEKATLGAVILGITLSTLHQSGLGALYLMARPKIHPLWYSEMIPVLFFVSSIFAGLSMVMVEASLSRRLFAMRAPGRSISHDAMLRGLARICAGAMVAYLFLKAIAFVRAGGAAYLGTGWGAWYLLEVLGFVLLPCLLFARASRGGSPRAILAAAGLTIGGIVLNRLNVAVIAFKWYLPYHYVPSWMEVVVTLAVVVAEIWVFRWVVNRMPVLEAEPGAEPRLHLVAAA